MSPQGWLIDPNRKWLLLFHREPSDKKSFTNLYMDKWSMSSLGTPYSFKSRREVKINAAIETWDELIGNGWKRIGSQFGEQKTVLMQE